MAVCRKRTERPAKWGPGTDGPVWDGFRWTLPLNAEGRRFAAGFITKYDGWPAACLLGGADSRSGRAVYQSARKHLGDEELNSVACEAVVEAAGRYDPTQFGCTEEGYSYIVRNVYFCVIKALRRSTKEHKQAKFTSLVGDDGEPAGMDELAGEPESPPPVDLLAEYGHVLSVRESRAMRFRYHLGLKGETIAHHLRVSRTRVGQITLAAKEKLRAAVAGLDTRQNPGDGTHPPRSLRCKRSERTAASRTRSKASGTPAR